MKRELLLAFQGRVSRTICGFTSPHELDKFVRSVRLDHWNKLPTVNPLKNPVPLFDTASEAIVHFGVS